MARTLDLGMPPAAQLAWHMHAACTTCPNSHCVLHLLQPTPRALSWPLCACAGHCVHVHGTGHTAQVDRTAARSKVKEQAEKYAAIFAQQNPDMEVVAATCCESLDDMLQRCKVPQIKCWRKPVGHGALLIVGVGVTLASVAGWLLSQQTQRSRRQQEEREKERATPLGRE